MLSLHAIHFVTTPQKSITYVIVNVLVESPEIRLFSFRSAIFLHFFVLILNFKCNIKWEI